MTLLEYDSIFIPFSWTVNHQISNALITLPISFIDSTNLTPALGAFQPRPYERPHMLGNISHMYLCATNLHGIEQYAVCTCTEYSSHHATNSNSAPCRLHNLITKKIWKTLLLLVILPRICAKILNPPQIQVVRLLHYAKKIAVAAMIYIRWEFSRKKRQSLHEAFIFSISVSVFGAEVNAYFGSYLQLQLPTTLAVLPVQCVTYCLQLAINPHLN